MFKGAKEGWGITTDLKNRLLYVSDGTANITVVSADNLSTVKQFVVRNGRGEPVPYINELEWINGFLWANVFGLDALIKIDPKSGYIMQAVDLSPLHKAEINVAREMSPGLKGYDWSNNILNGIAFDEATNEMYVTGKRWNLMFKLRLDAYI